MASVGFLNSSYLMQCMQGLQVRSNGEVFKLDTPMPFNPNDKLNPNDEQIAAAQEEFKNIYDDIINSRSFKPNSKEEFATGVNAHYKQLLYGEAYPFLLNPHQIDKSLPIDIDSEFNKFLESKGCADESELQVLNNTMFKTTEELRYFSEARLRGSLYNLDKNVAPNAMAGAKALVKNVGLEQLANYVTSDTLTAKKMEQGFLENYSGNEIKQSDLYAWQKEFNAYMQIFENQYKEAMKNANPADQLKSVDYSKYDEKYGEKYEKTLALNYEE